MPGESQGNRGARPLGAWALGSGRLCLALFLPLTGLVTALGLSFLVPLVAASQARHEGSNGAGLLGARPVLAMAVSAPACVNTQATGKLLENLTFLPANNVKDAPCR